MTSNRRKKLAALRGEQIKKLAKLLGLDATGTWLQIDQSFGAAIGLARKTIENVRLGWNHFTGEQIASLTAKIGEGKAVHVNLGAFRNPNLPKVPDVSAPGETGTKPARTRKRSRRRKVRPGPAGQSTATGNTPPVSAPDGCAVHTVVTDYRKNKVEALFGPQGTDKKLPTVVPIPDGWKATGYNVDIAGRKISVQCG